ncbi:MAG TPA: GvpL/GvpF family gas vesicle protein [Solirubrobacteraceae bacterium]|jgi:hypothetical protein
MPLYAYGLMRAEDGQEAAKALTEASVEAIELGGICALVTSLGEGDLTLRRESALAHSDTLQAAFQHGPVLPVRFGTVLGDAGALRDELLAPQATALRARLEALEGLAEMQVKATYVEEPLLRSIVGGDPRLAQTAARIRELPAAATHFERIRLGETISQEVEARRQQDSHQLVEALAPLAVAISLREPRHERAVLNASFLVAQDRLEAFDAEMERFAQGAAGRIRFKLIGPMPAHSFAEGRWQAGVPDGSVA